MDSTVNLSTSSVSCLDLAAGDMQLSIFSAGKTQSSVWTGSPASGSQTYPPNRRRAAISLKFFDFYTTSRFSAPSLARHLRSNSGFVLISMTFILMLLLLTLAVGLSLYSHLSLNQRSLHICQSELLRAQSRVGKNLDQLFVLNSEAMGLRAQKKAAELELAIAIAARNPLGVSQATIKLQKIRLAREALAATQNRLLLLSQQEIARAQTFTLAKVKEFFANENIRWHGHFSISLNSIFSLPITLAVKPDVVGDIAPVYETVEPFSAKQALQVSWKSSRSTESGMWTDILHNHTDRWEQKCTVTLKQNKEHFEPALVWDKFF